MAEQIVDIMEANMPVSSDVAAVARSAGGAAGLEAGAAAGREEAAALAGVVSSRVDALSARVDSIVASGGGDGGEVGDELRDVRVGYDGDVYASAGAAVRRQVELSLKSLGFTLDESLISSPYDDLDTLPDMSVVTYSADMIAANVGHMPEGLAKGTIVTLSGIPYGVVGNDGGKMQVFCSSNADMAVRVKWHNPAKWTGWRRLVCADHLPLTAPTPFLLADSYDPPYDDLDNLPFNSIVTYGRVNSVSHVPPTFQSGSIITLTGRKELAHANSAGIHQIAVGGDGIMWSRSCWYHDGQWTRWNSMADAGEDEYASLTVFPRIGVVGDSYCSGEIYVGDSGADYYELSWGQCIARLCGVSCVNYSRGGLSTRTWLTDDKGLALLKSTEPQNLYFICLGINDDHKLGLDYLGSETDMHDDWADNPDTFHGNYARIIGEIQAHAPKAKIIPITVSNLNNVIHDEFNTAIEAIAARYGLPCLKADDDPFFASKLYQDMVGGHPTALGYSGMAKAYMRLFSKAAVRYKTYFDDYTGN